MKNLLEYLRLMMSLMQRCPSNKQILVNGLVGVVLGGKTKQTSPSGDFWRAAGNYCFGTRIVPCGKRRRLSFGASDN